MNNYISEGVSWRALNWSIYSCTFYRAMSQPPGAAIAARTRRFPRSKPITRRWYKEIVVCLNRLAHGNESQRTSRQEATNHKKYIIQIFQSSIIWCPSSSYQVLWLEDMSKSTNEESNCSGAFLSTAFMRTKIVFFSCWRNCGPIPGQKHDSLCKFLTNFPLILHNLRFLVYVSWGDRFRRIQILMMRIIAFSYPKWPQSDRYIWIH